MLQRGKPEPRDLGFLPQGINLKREHMEALGRVELPTNGLGNRCSIHLSYRA